MVKSFIILNFILFTNHVMKDTTDQKQWVNPEITCSINPMEKPVKQFPYERDTKVSNNDLLSFCELMKKTFEISNFTISEAAKMYESLFENKVYRNDGSYGMPSPNDNIQPLTFTEFKSRTAIKRLGENTVAVYFYWIGCGVNFEYYECNFENKKITNINRVMAWSASAPC